MSLGESISTPLDDIVWNIESAAAWGWRFTDPYVAETWRPPALRPWLLASTRTDVVSFACSGRDGSLTPADRAEARTRYIDNKERKRAMPGSDALFGGRLLWHEPERTVWDQLSQQETCDWLDEHDCPPWETWVGWIEPADSDNGRAFLIAWVHPDLLDRAQSGMQVIACESVGWLDERPCPTADSLRTAGYLS